LTCPMPTPTLALPLASRMPFDFTERHAFQAKMRSSRVSSSAGSPVTSVQPLAVSWGSSAKRSASWYSRPPEIWRTSRASRTNPSGSWSRRRFFFVFSTSSAASSNPGATSTSVKISFTVSAMPRVTTRLAAMTPPNAETGSHSCARRCADAIGSGAFGFAKAIPHGFACLMMATAGLAKSYAARTAASAST
jgi:hypothetical protein